MILRTIIASLALFSFVNFGNATYPSHDNDNTCVRNNKTEGREDSGFDGVTSEGEAKFSVTGDEIVETAMKYLGRPYRRGAAGPKVFDCSGFTSFVFSHLNISLNRDSRTQYKQGVSVERKDLRVGDLVFFTSPRSGSAVGHVGIVSKVEDNGNFHFVHAARRGVIVDNFRKASYYNTRYIGARRILVD